MARTNNAKHRHRLRGGPEEERHKGTDTAAEMALDRLQRSRRTTTEIISWPSIEGLVSSGAKEAITKGSLKFKRKRRSSIGQLRNFYQSQSPMLRLLVGSLLVALLLNSHIVPVSTMSIAAVTNEPPTLMMATRSSSNNSSGRATSETVATSNAIPSPIIRLPSNSLIKYTAYRDVSILHFQVPRDTRTLYYSFRAHEEFKSAFCK